jgi:hypothetical protein
MLRNLERKTERGFAGIERESLQAEPIKQDNNACGDPYRRGNSVWVLKATRSSLVLVFFSVFVCLAMNLGPFTANKATGLSVVRASTFYNPWWWGLTVGSIAFAFAWFYLRRNW